MKKKLLIGIALILIYFLTGRVYATNIEMNIQEEVNMGDIIHVNLEIKNISQEEAINVIQGKFEYDKDIFEKVKKEDFKLLDNWSIVYNDQNTDSEGKFVLLNLSEGVEQDKKIGEITLKVKDNIKSTDTIVKLCEMSTVENDEIKKIEDNESKIKINGKFSIKYFFINLINIFFGH